MRLPWFKSLKCIYFNNGFRKSFLMVCIDGYCFDGKMLNVMQSNSRLQLIFVKSIIPNFYLKHFTLRSL